MLRHQCLSDVTWCIFFMVHHIRLRTHMCHGPYVTACVAVLQYVLCHQTCDHHYIVTCAFSAAFTLSFWCYASSHAPLVLAKSRGCERLVSSTGLNQMSGFLAAARTDHWQLLLHRWLSVVFDRSCHSWPRKTSSWPWSSLAETGRYVRCKQFSSLGQWCVYNIAPLDLCS